MRKDHTSTMWLVLLGMILVCVGPSMPLDSLDSTLGIPSLEDMERELGDFKLETLDDLEAYGKALREQARLQISKFFSAEARRYKRDLDTKSANVTGLDLLGFDPSQGSSWTNRIAGFEVLRHDGNTYFITGGPRTENVALTIYNPSNYQLDVVATFTLYATTIDKVDIIAAAVDSGILWMALGSSSSRLVSIVCVHLTTGEVKQPQNIPTKGVLGALHMFRIGDFVYLVIGNRFLSNPDDTHGVSEIHMLMGKYFDRRDAFSLECTGVHSITGFEDGRSYIITLGMDNNKGAHVYQLDPLADTITFVQELTGITNVNQVIHFVDAHDFKHYVMLKSRDQPANIYWWDNSQLVSWQILNTGPLSLGSSLGYITLNNLETVLFIAERNEIKVFVDDLTGHYYQTFSVTTSCLSILNLSGVKSGTQYLIYYICVGAVNVLQRRIVTFQEVDLVSQDDQGDTLLECLNQLNSTLESRKPDIAYLEDIVTNDRLMMTDRNQVWTGHIVFSEVTVTATTNFTQSVNIVNINRPDTATPESLNQLETSVARLEEETALVQGELSSVLHNSGNQTITGPINASSLLIDNLEIDFLEIGSINGVELSSLANTFLIDGIDQTITGIWDINYLKTDTLNTRVSSPPARINGVLTSDLMRLSVSNQVVTGNHTYNTIIASQICNSLCDGFSVNINGIDSSTIVTQGSDVTFVDKKTFTDLNVNGELVVDLLNGINIRDLASKVIFKDDFSRQTLNGKFTFDRVEVRGNVDTSSINGVNFRQLYDSAVKTTGNYNLAGGLVYNSDLVISNSLTTASVNNILWSNFVDLDSPNLITGMYQFEDVTILGSLISDDINGLDFSQEVALTDREQTINGRITFTQSVDVNGPKGVIMEQGGTVNGIDPSELQISQNNLETIVISEPVTLSDALDITGNINIRSINGLILEGIENRYWSLGKDQIISSSVQLDDAIFNGPVTANTLNGRLLSDYLQNYGNEIITGTFSFLGTVRVEGDLKLDPGRTVDGVDLSELQKNAVTLSGQQTITGPITFEGKLTIIGDLDLNGKINGIDVTRDLMRLDQSLPHTGTLTFASKTVINVLDITNGHLTLASLNGLDVNAAAADVVLVDEDVVIQGGGGLQFTGQVKVNELYVRGDIDGVNLEELLSKALLKNSAQVQVINERLVVEGDVTFQNNLTLNRVNSKVWSDHLNNVVPFDYTGLISGRKIFLQPITVDGDFNPTSINGIDIALLASRILRRSGEQTIDGFYTFNQDFEANAIFAPIIDGVDMAKILLIDVPGGVSGTVAFADEVNFLNGITSDKNILDGCDLKNIQTSVTTTNGEVNIFNDVMIDRLIIRGNATTTGSVFAGVLNLLTFLDNLVLKSADQIITAPVQFDSVTVENLNTNLINRVNINELLRIAALRKESNIINCDVRFTQGVRVGNLIVRTSLSGRGGGGVLVNGIDVSQVASKAVFSSDGTVLISGVKTFLNGIEVEDLVVAGSLGGVPVSNLVSLSRTDRFASGITFAAPITVRGNLEVDGLVDGVDLKDFLDNRINLNSTQTMFTSCTFENLRIEGDLEIDKINNVVLSDLVLRSASSQTISGKKNFLGGLHVNGNILVETINGINIDNLLRSVIRVDQDTTFNFQVTFNSLVRVTANVLVAGQVNGFDLSELNAGSLSDLLVSQYYRIETIRNQFGSITQENYDSAREMYAALSYLERLKYPRETNVTGPLWVGSIPEVGPGLFLKVSVCPANFVGRPCGCNAECHYYRVTSEAHLEPYVKLGYKINLLSHALTSNTNFAIYSSCNPNNGEPNTQVKVALGSGGEAFIRNMESDLGLVADSVMLVSYGKSYIVTASQFLEVNPTLNTTINVLTPDITRKTINKVWSKSSKLSAVDVDAILIEDLWYVLVTNGYDASNYVDPYSAKSELYVWNQTYSRLSLKGEYIADHATSGIFLNIEHPVQEYFFSLTQYKSADFNIYEDNLQFTANVLIFRYNQISKDFESFQVLNVHGIMGQALLTVHKNYYLLLASAKYNQLYVYQYYHSEGFRIYSTLRVDNPTSIGVLYLEEGIYVAVSTSNGVERFRVKTKGLNPEVLLLDR